MQLTDSPAAVPDSGFQSNSILMHVHRFSPLPTSAIFSHKRYQTWTLVLGCWPALFNDWPCPLLKSISLSADSLLWSLWNSIPLMWATCLLGQVFYHKQLSSRSGQHQLLGQAVLLLFALQHLQGTQTLTQLQAAFSWKVILPSNIAIESRKSLASAVLVE